MTPMLIVALVGCGIAFVIDGLLWLGASAKEEALAAVLALGNLIAIVVAIIAMSISLAAR